MALPNLYVDIDGVLLGKNGCLSNGIEKREGISESFG